MKSSLKQENFGKFGIKYYQPEEATVNQVTGNEINDIDYWSNLLINGPNSRCDAKWREDPLRRINEVPWHPVGPGVIVQITHRKSGEKTGNDHSSSEINEI